MGNKNQSVVNKIENHEKAENEKEKQERKKAVNEEGYHENHPAEDGSINNKAYDEEEMLKKIAESARDLKAPDALKPDGMISRLKRGRNRKRRSLKMAAAAACLCLCFGGGSLAMRATNIGLEENQKALSGIDFSQSQSGRQKAVEDTADEASVIEKETDEMAIVTDDSDSEDQAEVEAPLKKIGKMYTLASDYGEVYDVVKKSSDLYRVYRNSRLKEEEKQALGIVNIGAATEDMDVSSSSMAGKDSESDSIDYSGTNLQVEGVDESDIVKTDGRYIYVVQKDCVQVIDIQNKVPKAAAKIMPDVNEDTDQICEMYVADQVLTLILQTEKVSMQEKQRSLDSKAVSKTEESKEDIEGETRVLTDNGEEVIVPETNVEDLAGDQVYTDAYYMDVRAITKVMTYDITDPENAVLLDTTTQDGWYDTSRKIDSCLYLFTNKSLYIDSSMLRKRALEDGSVGRWLPCINEKAVSADCIYLPKEGNRGFIMSSIDLADHNKILDTKLVVDNHPQLYVSRNSVYLYQTDYINETEKTRIARFELENGRIRAKAAASVKGEITDTFAIHENGNYLQVLTSLTSSEPWENRVYVLDENMEKIGKLTGLAEGEMIYSARFVGTTGYFVTYRNTDPLFTVDFSNPRDPQIIGELKVTGYSEYLHFWDDNRLLGIGYETDPVSGNTIGVKLSMFDISNPKKVTEEAKVVLSGADECEAMHNYKCALVNNQKNIIAFTTEKYREGYQEHYRVFSYQDGKFVNRLEYSIDGSKGYDSLQWRSVYSGEILYLAGEKKIIAFDMENGWKKIGKEKY